MIRINANVHVADDELSWQFVRSSGPGGQHVNKVSTAVLLQFDIAHSSLPEIYKSRLLQLSDHRITPSGKILIKCQQSRSQEQNRELALLQFVELVHSVSKTPKKRFATKPSYGSQQKRLQQKKQQGQTKALRRDKGFE
ncbi:aminoacyl-tRNA hydrolase [Alishewanella sp. 16-MA]|uniref:Aminoacyl-tRNA hydrolase n=1 Tax=Alishewanella maricola TaxID=2795740 RepID=A0ABS8BZM3_9ALTE|nr:aminoacyl-tRNA hydrolase [Alishewanella maricola]